MKRALILGITGQDGSFLADVLLERGYQVHGLYRRSSLGNLSRIHHVLDRVTLHQGDMADPLSIERAIRASRPSEVYNEADQDSVGWSHQCVGYTMDITAAAVGRTLETIRQFDKSIRFFQPCSAMMFGDAALLTEPGFPSPQNEETRFNPMSPYACAKVAAYHLCRFYRQVHGMFVSVGILYNHDSPRRTEDYLLHKICRSAVRIKRGLQESVALGNLDSRVDIGYAREYMEAAHAMLQLDKPDDFVIATGNAVSVGHLVADAFGQLNIAADRNTVVRDERFWRNGIRGTLVGDATKAKKAFGFSPKTNWSELIAMLIKHAERELHEGR
jgi:GDPmannose 4,6-dehydratase